MLWTSILGVGTNGVYLHPLMSSQRLLPQKWHHVLLLVPESQTDLLLGIILPWASYILKLHFHSHLNMLTSLAAPNGELTIAVETPVRPFGFRLVFHSVGKLNSRQHEAGMTEQRANESLLSARLSGDQLLPQLGPSFNANGHLHEVKEWFWLSQSHDMHIMSWPTNGIMINGASMPWSLFITTSVLLSYIISPCYIFICIKIFSSQGLTWCMSFTGSCVHTSVYPVRMKF